MSSSNLMVYKMWKQACSDRALCLEYRTPEHFTRCHWQIRETVNPLWIAYRTAMAIYFSLTSIYIFYPNIFYEEQDSEHLRKVLIFLTNWTYLLETLVFILFFFVVIRRALLEQVKTVEPLEKMPTFYKIVWVFYTISLPSALTVTLVFWSFVYEPKKFRINMRNFISHVFNSVFIILDFCLTAHPFQPLHFYMPALYGTIYSAFSMAYQLSGGTGVEGNIPIYSILDWRQPGPTIISCIFTFALLILIHLIFSLLHIFKIWLKRRKKSTPSIEAEGV